MKTKIVNKQSQTAQSELTLFPIIRHGDFMTVTLSKKSSPGDGTSGNGTKGM